MNNSDFNNDEDGAKTTVASKEKTPGTIHAIVSIVYIGAIVLSSPLILWSLVYSYGLLIAVIWAIGSIVVSRVLINHGNILIAYFVLFSAPVVAWLFMIQ